MSKWRQERQRKKGEKKNGADEEGEVARNKREGEGGPDKK